jgi:hypothetical protein
MPANVEFNDTARLVQVNIPNVDAVDVGIAVLFVTAI